MKSADILRLDSGARYLAGCRCKFSRTFPVCCMALPAVGVLVDVMEVMYNDLEVVCT